MGERKRRVCEDGVEEGLRQILICEIFSPASLSLL